MTKHILILVTACALCGALTGCWLTDRGPGGGPSPAQRAATGAAQGFAGGGPIGALLGGLGGLLMGGGAAVAQRRKRDRVIRQLVTGVGQYLQRASKDDSTVLRQLLHEVTDENSRAIVAKHRFDTGVG